MVKLLTVLTLSKHIKHENVSSIVRIYTETTKY